MKTKICYISYTIYLMWLMMSLLHYVSAVDDIGFDRTRTNLSSNTSVKIYDFSYSNNTNQTINWLNLSIQLNTGDRIVWGSGAWVRYGDRWSNYHLIALDNIPAQTHKKYQFIIQTNTYNLNTYPHAIAMMQFACQDSISHQTQSICNGSQYRSTQQIQTINSSSDVLNVIPHQIYQSYFYDNMPGGAISALIDSTTPIQIKYGCMDIINKQWLTWSTVTIPLTSDSCTIDELWGFDLVLQWTEQSITLPYIVSYGSWYIIDTRYHNQNNNQTAYHTQNTGSSSTYTTSPSTTNSASTSWSVTTSTIVSQPYTDLQKIIQEILAIKKNTEMKYFRLLAEESKKTYHLKKLLKHKLATEGNYVVLKIKIPIESLSSILWY